MAFKMKYDKRNRENIAKLADKTRQATLLWYEYCESIGFDILIYETIRTKQTQAQYVSKGVSQTMKSWHLVGQALDFVPVVNGKTSWASSGYKTSKAKQALKKAKSLGFEWGGDWKSFKDLPHLQYSKVPYGKDTFGKLPSKPSAPVSNTVKEGSKGALVKEVQGHLVRHGYKVAIDGIFGAGTEAKVKEFQKDHGLTADGIVGTATLAKLKESDVKIGQATADVWAHSKANTSSSTRTQILPKGSKWKVYGEENGMYRVGNEYVSKKYIKLV